MFSYWYNSCMASRLLYGCLGDDHQSESMLREMSHMKMQAPVDRGFMKDCFTKTLHFRRREPVCSSFLIVPIFLLLFSLVTPALSIHMESIDSHSEFSCEPIRLRMCQDLPYNTTFMPNLLNHYDQQTAALAMEVGCLCVIQALYALCACECSTALWEIE